MGHRRHSVRDDAFDIITADAAYWLGFIFADGSVDRAARRLTVKLTASDEGHLIKLRRFLGSTHTIGHEAGRRNPAGYLCRPACRLSVTSPRIGSRVLELGRYEGSIDPVLVESPDFWRGVIDGDGTVGVRPNGDPFLSLAGRKRILEAFRNFMFIHDLPGRMTIRPATYTLQLCTTGRFAFPMIDALYGHGGPMLDRKAQTAQRFIAVNREGAAASASRAADLRVRYEAGATIRKLSGHYGVTDPTILRWMTNAGIPRRPRSGGPVRGRTRRLVDMTEVCSRYTAGESLEDVASALRVSVSTLRRRAAAGGFELRYHTVARMARDDQVPPEASWSAASDFRAAS